ncbi:response regulator [Galbibacter sp. BG1]|uniref:response regulator n=1 Tax=Galbibacter sp. BG1 TaxID=1170699 RepID=UPI0015C0B6B8|nr:response regulator [Galbibacter sp. BG1]QLE00134.1 response regulator [Galbibacter sp. BG1]
MINKKMLVAVADDDAEDLLFFKKAIASVKMATELFLFNNGQELMDYLNTPGNPMPDIVFLDLNMPVKNGMESLREIRYNSRFKNLSVAIYSTSTSESDIKKTFILGANVYINKPNSLVLLKEVIEKVLNMNWQYQNSKMDKDNFLLRL